MKLIIKQKLSQLSIKTSNSNSTVLPHSFLKYFIKNGYMTVVTFLNTKKTFLAMLFISIL